MPVTPEVEAEAELEADEPTDWVETSFEAAEAAGAEEVEAEEAAGAESAEAEEAADAAGAEEAAGAAAADEAATGPLP